MGLHTGIVKKRDDYHQEELLSKKGTTIKKGRLLSKGTTEKRDYYQKKNQTKGIEKVKLSRNALFH